MVWMEQGSVNGAMRIFHDIMGGNNSRSLLNYFSLITSSFLVFMDVISRCAQILPSFYATVIYCYFILYINKNLVYCEMCMP
ncbi:hypothetical protein EB796_013273 [Bugula neritina]|uniref:Uncharacterized protein n=1 Tax=Bugula neritina TaxID=10212 RepID=A0A7J7JRU7_BUGNE|nr:hypothetical protein EB796_013273 [Bugula neritina]